MDTNSETSSLLGATNGRFRQEYGIQNAHGDTRERSREPSREASREPSINEYSNTLPKEPEVINANYESVDYDVCENEPYLQEDLKRSNRDVMGIGISRWVVNFFIGLITALIACFIDICIETLCNYKYRLVKNLLDSATVTNYTIYILLPFFVVLAWNAAAVFVASMMTAFIEPVAAGSGIPQIKCYLNGVLIPRVVRFKTLCVKVTGVILSVVGGLAIGKEGPMIHSGAVVAAGISQGRSTSFPWLDTRLFKYFRNDVEKRDFVAAGAAAGVSAAFGAPIGGVMFALEEGASHWYQGQTWRAFFASIVSFFTLNLVLSIYNGHPWELNFQGLLNFGSFTDLQYSWLLLIIFAGMGVMGGLLGALFNQINCKLTVFRMKYLKRRGAQVLEAVLVAVMSGVIAMVLLYYGDECQPLGKDPTEVPVQLFCADGQYSTMAALWMQPPEASVRSLFHDPSGSFSDQTLILFAVVYFLLSTWTYGLTVPSGLFIPSLLTGAAWGRLVGQLCESFGPEYVAQFYITPGKFALIGAAAQLAGNVRMTLSLAVILIEASSSIQFGLPLMIVLVIAKLVGDIFNEGLYDIHIEKTGVPLLGWEPPLQSSKISAKEVMSYPVVTFQAEEKVGYIVDMLTVQKHQGFPVVISRPQMSSTDEGSEGTNNNSTEPATFGTLIGLITRTQLVILLQHKIYERQRGELRTEDEELGEELLTVDDFRKAYPRYSDIQDVEISEEDREKTLSLRHYMNPAPYAVSDRTSLPRIFKLVRGLGLRHVVVTTQSNEVIGMVTRKDLCRFKFHKIHGLRERLGFRK